MSETKRRVFTVINLRTGETTGETYASIKNVIRYGLQKNFYEPGQYDICDPTCTGDRVRAYKQA